MTTSTVMRRAANWLWRYGPSELLGTAAALLGAAVAYEIYGSAMAAALAANGAEFIAYYGLMFWRALRASGPFSAQAALIVARNLRFEFGPSELLDGTLVRPAALYAAMTFTPSLVLGALLGKVAADLCFYMPAVIAYELRVRFLPGREIAAGHTAALAADSRGGR
jgi:hypothetical protein